MSIRLLQSNVPQEYIQTIKVNDLTVRGNVVANNTVSVQGGITTNAELGFEANSSASVSGTIRLPALTVTSQLTSTTTNVGITGDPQQFVIETFDGSIAAGASASFNVFNTSCVAGKTLILCSNDVSDNTLLTVNSFVAYQSDGAFLVTRHNFGTVAATGKQKIIFKLIQST